MSFRLNNLLAIPSNQQKKLTNVGAAVTSSFLYNGNY